MSRKGPLGGLSWLQLLAGALAAMTSAWVASYLGVAGTIIGAAVGSLVASIASAVYINGLDKGHTFITESGTVVTRAEPQDEQSGDDTEVLVTEEESVVSVEGSERRFSWPRVLMWTGLALATSLLLIGGYEWVTGSAFGNPDNPTIGSTRGDTSSEPTDEPSSEPTTAPTSEPTTGATTVPTTAVPTTQPTTEPAPEPTTEPTPAPSAQTDDPGAGAAPE